MSESNYWDKFWRKRMSRRRLMSGALVVGGGLAAASVVGCTTDSSTSTSGGTGAWMAEPGESYHSFSDEPGGLWRFQDRGPHRLVGSGFVAQGFDSSTYYRRTRDSFDPRVAFAFEGIGADERIGDFGLLGGGAAGIEVDSAEPSLGTPPHALVVASSEDLTDSYLLAHEHMIFATPIQIATANPMVRADMVFFETANGGAVFGVGLMAWCGSLSHNRYDNNVSRITRNVLRRFAAKKPF